MITLVKSTVVDLTFSSTVQITQFNVPYSCSQIALTFIVKTLYCSVTILCGSSEAGGAVEAAAAPAEEGTSREHAHGGASQRGSQQRVLKALL